MKTLSSAALIEKNKSSATSAWLFLLEIGLPEVVRLTNNNENVEWGGETWQTFAFEIDALGETGKGEIPSVGIKVSNVTGEIQSRLEAADGASGTPVILRVLNTSATDTALDLELSYVLDSVPKFDEQWITFKLSGANCLSRRVPRRRYMRNYCSFIYGGIECGVPASTLLTFPTCDGTSANCIERGNDSRFGGFRWMPEQ